MEQKVIAYIYTLLWVVTNFFSPLFPPSLAQFSIPKLKELLHPLSVFLTLKF